MNFMYKNLHLCSFNLGLDYLILRNTNLFRFSFVFHANFLNDLKTGD